MVPIWQAKKIKGKQKLEFQQQDRFAAYLSSFRDGTELEVIVRKRGKQISLPQMRYYFGVIIAMLCEETGVDNKEAMHTALKIRFLSEVDAKSGLMIVKSYSSLETAEAEEYHAKVKRWAAEFLNLAIPDPNQSIDWSNRIFYP
jgi:hypothetical protein